MTIKIPMIVDPVTVEQIIIDADIDCHIEMGNEGYVMNGCGDWRFAAGVVAALEHRYEE